METPIGGQPGADIRDYLAEERTFLAWIRTGLALMGFGFVVARFGLFLAEIQLTHSKRPRGTAEPVLTLVRNGVDRSRGGHESLVDTAPSAPGCGITWHPPPLRLLLVPGGGGRLVPAGADRHHEPRSARIKSPGRRWPPEAAGIRVAWGRGGLGYVGVAIWTVGAGLDLGPVAKQTEHHELLLFQRCISTHATHPCDEARSAGQRSWRSFRKKVKARAGPTATPRSRGRPPWYGPAYVPAHGRGAGPRCLHEASAGICGAAPGTALPRER